MKFKTISFDVPSNLCVSKTWAKVKHETLSSYSPINGETIRDFLFIKNKIKCLLLRSVWSLKSSTNSLILHTLCIYFVKKKSFNLYNTSFWTYLVVNHNSNTMEAYQKNKKLYCYLWRKNLLSYSVIITNRSRNIL